MKKVLSLFMTLSLAIILITGCAPKVTVETREASKITDNDAFVNGYIAGYDNMPASVGIYFGTNEEDMKKIIADAHPNNVLTSEDIDVTYDITVDGEKTLEPDTTYYYCFYARLENGKETKGEIKSFKTITSEEVPVADLTVETGEVKEITDINAQIYGHISNFSEKPDEAGLYLGTTEDNLKKVARDPNPIPKGQENRTEIDVWYDLRAEAHMDLEPDTTYYYRCYARIGDAETKGEIKSFKTLPAATAAPATDAPTESAKPAK